MSRPQADKKYIQRNVLLEGNLMVLVIFNWYHNEYNEILGRRSKNFHSIVDTPVVASGARPSTSIDFSELPQKHKHNLLIK